MIIYNKYKTTVHLNLDNFIDFKMSVEKNSFRLFSLFKHSKRLIRSLLLLHFYLYLLYPFCPLLFRSTARYHIKLDSTILILVDLYCYDSYFKFN